MGALQDSIHSTAVAEQLRHQAGGKTGGAKGLSSVYIRVLAWVEVDDGETGHDVSGGHCSQGKWTQVPTSKPLFHRAKNECYDGRLY